MEYRVIGEYTPMIQFENGTFVKNGSYACIVTNNPHDINGWVELWNIEKNEKTKALSFWGGYKIRIEK